MLNTINYQTLCKEIVNVSKVVDECSSILKTRSGYKGMSLEELSIFYDRVEGGLISYYLVFNSNSHYVKEMLELEKNKDCCNPGNFLEAQLLNVSLNMLLKDCSYEFPEKFKESLWREKLMKKVHFNSICDIANILPEHRERLYWFLHS